MVKKVYSFEEIKNNVLNWVNNSNVKICIVNTMTGELFTSQDVRALKSVINPKDNNFDIFNLCVFGIDEKSVTFLNDYLTKCKEYLLNKRYEYYFHHERTNRKTGKKYKTWVFCCWSSLPNLDKVKHWFKGDYLIIQGYDSLERYRIK